MVQGELRGDRRVAGVARDVGAQHPEVVQEGGGVGDVAATATGPAVRVLPTQPRLW